MFREGCLMSNYFWGMMVCLSALILSACTLGADADVSPSNHERHEKKQIDDGDGYELRPEIENVNDHLDYTNSDLKTIYFAGGCFWGVEAYMQRMYGVSETSDRKSTRLNSSHVAISYAVFCLKKKKEHRLTAGGG